MYREFLHHPPAMDFDRLLNSSQIIRNLFVQPTSNDVALEPPFPRHQGRDLAFFCVATNWARHPDAGTRGRSAISARAWPPTILRRQHRFGGKVEYASLRQGAYINAEYAPLLPVMRMTRPMTSASCESLLAKPSGSLAGQGHRIQRNPAFSVMVLKKVQRRRRGPDFTQPADALLQRPKKGLILHGDIIASQKDRRHRHHL